MWTGSPRHKWAEERAVEEGYEWVANPAAGRIGIDPSRMSPLERRVYEEVDS